MYNKCITLVISPQLKIIVKWIISTARDLWAGITNIYSKVYGSRTAINMVRATMNAIENLKTVEKVAALRGKAVNEIKH